VSPRILPYSVPFLRGSNEPAPSTCGAPLLSVLLRRRWRSPVLGPHPRAERSLGLAGVSNVGSIGISAGPFFVVRGAAAA